MKLADDVLRNAIAALRLDVENASPEEEKTVWSALDGLSSAIAPATAESVRELDNLAEDIHERRVFFRNWFADVAARKTIRWGRAWNLTSLVLLLILQIYALIGSGIMSDLTRLKTEFGEVQHELRDRGDAGTDATALLKEQEKTSLEDRIEAAYVALSAWNRAWQLPYTWLQHLVSRAAGTPGVSATMGPPVQADAAERAHQVVKANLATEQRARSALEALSLYLLPLLYGLLGASTYILRQLREQIDASTFTATAIFRYRLRLGLGAVLGATVGLFFTSDTPFVSATSLSLVAIAFLAGYGVEAVFSFLDFLVQKIRAATKPSPPAESSSPQRPG